MTDESLETLSDHNKHFVTAEKNGDIQDYLEGTGMYNMTRQDHRLHQQSMKRKEKTKIVRQESIMGLQDQRLDSAKHRNVAQRIFHNHEVTEARGDHAANAAKF